MRSLLLEEGVVCPFERIFVIEEGLVDLVALIGLCEGEVVVLEVILEVVGHSLNHGQLLVLHG